MTDILKANSDPEVNRYFSTESRIYQDNEPQLLFETNVFPRGTDPDDPNTPVCRVATYVTLYDDGAILHHISYSDLIELILLGIEKKQEMDNADLAAGLTIPAQVATGNI